MSRLYDDGTILYRVDTATKDNAYTQTYVYSYKDGDGHYLLRDDEIRHFIRNDNYVPISLFHESFKLSREEVCEQIIKNNDKMIEYYIAEQKKLFSDMEEVLKTCDVWKKQYIRK